MRSRRLGGIAVAAELVLAGCGSGGDGLVSASEAAAGAASALSFSSPAIWGDTVDGAASQGRPTQVWFWAP